MMIRLLVLLSLSHFLAEGKLEPSFDEMSAASKAQIRFAIENRYDDTGPGAKDPERAHRMYSNLDDALVAFMNDPDTKLPDADKIRAFRRLVGTDYGLPSPTQQHSDQTRGSYKLISVDPSKYKYEPITFGSHPGTWAPGREVSQDPQSLNEAGSHVHFQKSHKQNSHRPDFKAAAFVEHSKLNKDPFFEALDRDASLRHPFSHESLFDNAASRAIFQKPQVLKHNVFQRPSSNRFVFQPEVHSANSQGKPNFFDLQSTVVKAEKQYLLPQSRRENAAAPHQEYSYSYGVNNPKTGDRKSAQETRNPNGGVSGFYSLVEPDGNTRVVKYTADNSGFVASIDRPKGHFL